MRPPRWRSAARLPQRRRSGASSQCSVSDSRGLIALNYHFPSHQCAVAAVRFCGPAFSPGAHSPHCLNTNGTPALAHWSRSERVHRPRATNTFAADDRPADAALDHPRLADLRAAALIKVMPGIRRSRSTGPSSGSIDRKRMRGHREQFRDVAVCFFLVHDRRAKLSDTGHTSWPRSRVRQRLMFCLVPPRDLRPRPSIQELGSFLG